MLRRPTSRCGPDCLFGCGRDVVDDLLAGTDNESACQRAEALGHNLRVPNAYGISLFTQIGLADLGVTEQLDDGPVLPREERINQAQSAH